MSRSYAARCAERRARLIERAEYLTEKIEANPTKNFAYDAQERSALLWAVEQMELMDAITEVVTDATLTDAEKIAAIDGVIERRRRPSQADLDRTPALARRYA